MMYFLKADTEEQLINVLEPYGFRRDGTWVSVSFYEDRRVDLDVIGTISNVVDETTEEVLPGFHANLLWSDDVTLPKSIKDICIAPPSNPRRLFWI